MIAIEQTLLAGWPPKLCVRPIDGFANCLGPALP